MKLYVLVPLLALAAGIASAEPARDALLARYLTEAKKANPGFTGFSAERGTALFRTKHGGGDAATPSCTACHGDDPRVPGKNAKTGKVIEPMAVSANPKRFTDRAEVEKWFKRNCPQVLGRECTPAEKGDFITFMAGQ